MGKFPTPSSKVPCWNEVISFCQRLIQTPSLPGEEKEVASLIQREMEKLPYDDVWIDDVGNVIGVIKGEKELPSVMFTAHMDHVDPGDESQWEYPPYSGVIKDGYIHGRGASDTKGAIATQVFIPLLIQGLRHGTIYIAQVVLEEKGGLGSKHLVKKVKPDFVILGEPTENDLKIGHRGRIEIVVKIRGRMAHASTPEKGINPHYAMARFLLKLETLGMKKKGGYRSTVAPTLYLTDQTSSNVIPGEAILHLDWRNIPGETAQEVLGKIANLLPEGGSVTIHREKGKTYTGLTFEISRERTPYLIPEDHVLVRRTKKAVERALGRRVELRWWEFATDAGIFQAEGIPVVGFSPCEEKYAHTPRDRVSLELMREALECYPFIVQELAGSVNLE